MDPQPFLRATRDPDVCTLRNWDPKLHWIGGVLVVCAIAFGLFVHLRGAAALLALALFPLVLSTQRAVVNRRTSTFDLRYPWTSDAAPTGKPLAPDALAIRRYVSTAKGSRLVSYAVAVHDSDLAQGLGEEEARRLVAELREFLAGRGGPGASA